MNANKKFEDEINRYSLTGEVVVNSQKKVK